MKAKEVSKKQLVNALNYINFKEETVSLIFDDSSAGTQICLEAYPMPVLSDYPVFLFRHSPPAGLQASELTRLIIPNGTGHIQVEPHLHAASAKGLSIGLPETSRHIQGPPRDTLSSAGIRVRFHQKGLVFKGSLICLEPDSFQVRLSPLSSQYLMGITPKAVLRLTFIKENTILFETDARLMGEEKLTDGISLHFKAVESTPPPADAKQFGNKAFQLIPAPDFVFSHPLTHTMHSLVIDSLSAVGLTCTLHEESLPLLPGMTLENAAISLGDVYTLPLTARVTKYKTSLNEKGEKRSLCSIQFLNMDPEIHRKLQTMIHKSENRNIRISMPIDPDDLWRFFFETGFIYKNKYRLFLKNKEKIKKTYQALYSAPTEVTRHVTYQEKGRTMGHVSMLRYAERAWLFHHHAALKGTSIKAGLEILNHIIHYIYDSLWLKSAGMDYLICYFRPENAFPNFFFNGFTKKLGNPKACSADLFAYLYFRRPMDTKKRLPTGWTLETATEEDLVSFAASYEKTSGGLLVDALDLFEREAPAHVLTARFRKAGLKKERQIWAIRHHNRHAALVIVNTSDVALNMSELTNCIKVCITRPEVLTKEVLTQALNHLAGHYETTKIPVLVHPFSWVESSGFHFQKRYFFWVFNTQFSDHYMQHLNEINKLSGKQR